MRATPRARRSARDALLPSQTRSPAYALVGNGRLLPDADPAQDVILVLAEKLHLPKFAPDGQLMSYKFHHRRLGIQLRDDQTLSEQAVVDGDVVPIQHAITAGRA